MTTTELPSWLSTAGLIRNGGLRAPGQEGMKSQTGSSKPKEKPVVKESAKGTWDETKTLAENIGTDASKPITRGRVVAEGTYKFGETVARVKISQSSGNPYALVLKGGNWEYTPGVVKLLKASDRVEVPAQVANAVSEKIRVGFYGHAGTVAEVVASKAGRTYAKLLNTDTWKFDYVPGLVSKLKVEDRLTLAQAVELGKVWHHCGICGAELTADASIDRGIGPVCASKL